MVHKRVEHDFKLMSVMAVVALIAMIFLISPEISGDASITGNVIRSDVTDDSQIGDSQSCIDSDTGLDYSTKGRLRGDISYKFYSEDRCFMKYFLREVYCKNNRAASHITYCRSGCENGMCKEKTIQRKCGDKIITGWERCDGSNLGDYTCNSLGYIGGTLSCTRYCVLNISNCTRSVCGNDVQEIGEVCDGNDLNGKHCRNFGFARGILKCINCKFNTTDCIKGCSSDAECRELPCAQGMVHETCENGRCVLKANCAATITTKCAKEGEYTSGTVAPEYQYGCCAGLKEFDQYSGIDYRYRPIGGGNLCYNPNKGTPICFGQGTAREGWYYPRTQELLKLGKCPTTPMICGDGTISPGEECDGAQLNGLTCANFNLAYGSPTCVNCKLDVTGCSASPAGTTLYINPVNVNVFSGDTVTFDIQVSGVTNLYGYQFDINYNPNVLEFVSLTDGEFLGASPFCVDYSSTSGLIKSIACTRLGTTGVSGSGLLKKITFKALAKGTSDITLSNVKLVDMASATITTQVTSGQAIVNSSVVNLCGNAKLDAGEECEVGTWVSAACPPGESGSIGCKDCTLDYTKCIPVPEPGCGDGIVEVGEQCDGNNLNSKTCPTASNNFAGGILACTRDCVFDYSKCIYPKVCGDGIVSRPSDDGVNEVCDGTNLNDNTCQSRGFASGTLRCTTSCAFDTRLCSVCNNNGVCQPRVGETAQNCAGDCIFAPNYLSLFFNPQSIDVAAGNTVTFDIGVAGMNNLYGYQFDVNYNSNVLEFVSLIDGGFLSTSPFCVEYNATSGLIRNVACTRMGTSGVSGSGILKRISFRALAAGTNTIWLSNVKLIDNTLTEIRPETIGADASVS